MTIDIDQDLLKQAMELGQFKTKSEAVNAALAHYVRARRQHRITELMGTVEYDPEYDYKAERRKR